MSLPGATPGFGGLGGNNQMAGMSEQEQAMVKMVCIISSRVVADSCANLSRE